MIVAKKKVSTSASKTRISDVALDEEALAEQIVKNPAVSENILYYNEYYKYSVLTENFNNLNVKKAMASIYKLAFQASFTDKLTTRLAVIKYHINEGIKFYDIRIYLEECKQIGEKSFHAVFKCRNRNMCKCNLRFKCLLFNPKNEEDFDKLIENVPTALPECIK